MWSRGERGPDCRWPSAWLSTTLAAAGRLTRVRVCVSGWQAAAAGRR